MWLFFAIIATFFYALVNVLDSHNVENIFEKPWEGIVVSSIVTSLVLLASLPITLPLMSWGNPSWSIIGSAILSGIIIQINQALYFEALNHSNPSVVAAYWNMVPAFIPIASFFVFHETLMGIHYVGISILIITSVLISLIDAKFSKGWNAFVLIFVASWLQVCVIILMDLAFESLAYFTGVFLVALGLIFGGFFPLLFQDIHRHFFRHGPKLIEKFRLFLVIETCILISYSSLALALKFGSPSLVTAIEAITPGFVILISILGIKFIGTKKQIQLHLLQKLFLIGSMVIGVWLVSK